MYYVKRGKYRKVAQHFLLFAFLPAFCFPIAVSSPVFAQQPALRTTGQKAAPKSTEDTGTSIPGGSIQGWTLKFDEEFNDSAINYSRWSPHPPAKLLLTGLQSWTPQSIEISGGQAHIVARRTKNTYTSGFLTTFGTFAQTYGRFEIRFRIPAGRGLEPMFRLLPITGGDVPAIDVMNATGDEPSKALFSNHWGDARADRDYTGSYSVDNLSIGFHTIVLTWDEEKIIWTVDGFERFSSFDGVPHQPMYLAVSLGVGNEKSGDPDATTKFPATLDIDYIRVFARQ
jgi:beta-glucanase (GH16 family)